VKVKAKFVIGDRKEGYDVVRVDRKTEPWEARVWKNGSIRRRDGFNTQREAINYCHSRYRGFRSTGLKVHLRSRRS
jgi:hypothetical protein